MKQATVFIASIGTSDFSNATPCVAQTGGIEFFFTQWAAIVGNLSLTHNRDWAIFLRAHSVSFEQTHHTPPLEGSVRKEPSSSRNAGNIGPEEKHRLRRTVPFSFRCEIEAWNPQNTN
jgi:hypothetical protein